eukprot:CAMPEP_0181056986 /NCGR_PEP_ID=MMETSP1070-20121207/20006_1 /TAXON_ID=265543 /ORGANISM="Minutocellus polymorphus, Strain NH13" /LENGTH=160 /DNA_ID=CAMNT_0023136363 /DNA_START=335 /DNA_END=817 /DNA_ORIENTATION=+
MAHSQQGLFVFRLDPFESPINKEVVHVRMSRKIGEDHSLYILAVLVAYGLGWRRPAARIALPQSERLPRVPLGGTVSVPGNASVIMLDKMNGARKFAGYADLRRSKEEDDEEQPAKETARKEKGGGPAASSSSNWRKKRHDMIVEYDRSQPEDSNNDGGL